jgi:hypothetical protein
MAQKRISRGSNDMPPRAIGGFRILEVRRHFNVGQVLPVQRFGEELPALVRMISSLLTAKRAHCAVATNVLHCDLTNLIRELIPSLCVRVITVMSHIYFSIVGCRTQELNSQTNALQKMVGT